MQRIKSWMLVGLTVLVLAVSGCSWFQSNSDNTATASGDKPARQGTLGRYYDFDDIQVPTLLKLNKDQSILFRVGAFKAGVLAFSGSVEMESLINFFVESMAKDNWTLKSSFKYPKVALFFAKPGKTCVMQITEGWFDTKVDIWVAPSA